MKKIFALLAVMIIAGCSHPEYKTNIQAVLDQKDALRERLLGTVPFARVNFPATQFAAGLAAEPLAGCPADFRRAWLDYAAAWNDRATRHPDGVLLLQSELDLFKKGDALAAREDLKKYQSSVPVDRTPAAWRNVEMISARYGAFPR
jgi:hypothetical protein